MKVLKASFNRNDINKAIGTARKQIKELREVIADISGDPLADQSHSEQCICDKEIPKAVEKMVYYLEELVACRDDLLAVIQGKYDGIAETLAHLTNSLEAYSKPKSKGITE